MLALLFCTTHLHYTQNMMENNYIMLLTLMGFSFQYEWLRRQHARSGSGFSRARAQPADAPDHGPRSDGVRRVCALGFVVRAGRGRALWQRLLDYGKVAAPVYAFFVLIDRVYQFYRFGSFTNTYVALARGGAAPAGSLAAAELSLDHAVSRGLLGPAFRAGEVYLSV